MKEIVAALVALAAAVKSVNFLIGGWKRTNATPVKTFKKRV